MSVLPTDPHPSTGEPFVAGEIRRESDTQIVHYLPPERPDRVVVTEWNDDGEAVDCRVLTDDEYAGEMSATRLRAPGGARPAGWLAPLVA